jgi:hypothetical protein
MTRSTLTALLFALPGLAWAVPQQLAHQGRLLDDAGVPVEGAHALTFRLHDDSGGGSIVWEESIDVTFSSGYYSATLGTDEEGNPIDMGVLGQHPLFLDLAIDGGAAMEPRHEVLSVPFAMMADTCENVSGGIVDASEIRVDGEAVITEGGAWTGPTPSVDWSELTGVPDGFADNIDDDTVLGESEVEDYIEAYITDGPIELAEGSTIGGATIAAGDTVPVGAIIMWSGADIPEGWALCDGTAGTPDLRNRFVVGSGDAYTTGDSGSGDSALTVSTTRMGGSLCTPAHGGPCYDFVLGVSGGGGTPPYYALAYIMKLDTDTGETGATEGDESAE